MSARSVPWHARWARSASARASVTVSAVLAGGVMRAAAGWMTASDATSAAAPGSSGPATRTTRPSPRRGPGLSRHRGAVPEGRRRRQAHRAAVEGRPGEAVQPAHRDDDELGVGPHLQWVQQECDEPADPQVRARAGRGVPELPAEAEPGGARRTGARSAPARWASAAPGRPACSCPARSLPPSGPRRARHRRPAPALAGAHAARRRSREPPMPWRPRLARQVASRIRFSMMTCSPGDLPAAHVSPGSRAGHACAP